MEEKKAEQEARQVVRRGILGSRIWNMGRARKSASTMLILRAAQGHLHNSLLAIAPVSKPLACGYVRTLATPSTACLR